MKYAIMCGRNVGKTWLALVMAASVAHAQHPVPLDVVRISNGSNIMDVQWSGGGEEGGSRRLDVVEVTATETRTLCDGCLPTHTLADGLRRYWLQLRPAGASYVIARMSLSPDDSTCFDLGAPCPVPEPPRLEDVYDGLLIPVIDLSRMSNWMPLSNGGWVASAPDSTGVLGVVVYYPGPALHETYELHYKDGQWVWEVRQ